MAPRTRATDIIKRPTQSKRDPQKRPICPLHGRIILLFLHYLVDVWCVPQLREEARDEVAQKEEENETVRLEVTECVEQQDLLQVLQCVLRGALQCVFCACSSATPSRGVCWAKGSSSGVAVCVARCVAVCFLCVLQCDSKSRSVLRNKIFFWCCSVGGSV